MSPAPARRLGALLGVLLVGMAGISVRLAYVQGVRSEEYTQTAHRQRVRQIELPAPRGAIYDRNAAELAISVPARTVYANPSQVADPARTARTLAPLLGTGVEELTTQLLRDTTFVYLARRIGVVTGSAIQELKLPGIGVLDEARRVYPGDELAGPVVGFIGTDQRGLTGLEYAYEQLLAGEPGHRMHEQDPLGRRIPQGMFTEALPRPGADLVLTLDADLQFVMERELGRAMEETGAEGAMGVALDPRTGEILAMASLPGFNPNMIGAIDPQATHNRVVSDAFEPGSVNKVITASAALAEGAIGPDEHIWVPERIVVQDKEFIERKPARSLDLRGILTHSSNLGTIRLAQALGPEVLDDYFRRFGLGSGTGLGFPGEAAGLLPSASRWATSLPTMAIGQGLAVTTLQLAQMYATVANDGAGVEASLVAGWVDPGGDYHDAGPARSRRVIDVEVARALRGMLEGVVEEGTGRNAAVPGFRVAGKTGTAFRSLEGVGYQGHVASFVGMLPAQAPELVVAVVLTDPVPVEAGLVAAPVFSRIAVDATQILRMAPDVLQAPATVGSLDTDGSEELAMAR